MCMQTWWCFAFVWTLVREVLHKQGQRLMYTLIEKWIWTLLLSNRAVRNNFSYSLVILNQCFILSGSYRDIFESFRWEKWQKVFLGLQAGFNPNLYWVFIEYNQSINEEVMAGFFSWLSLNCSFFFMKLYYSRST